MAQINTPSEILPAICLAGPTASGKTALAVRLAHALGCEIVNADARQVYARFPIITAQPDAAEQQGIPHHLYGYLKTDEKICAGQWALKARELCQNILGRGRIPLVTGGTGFYFQAFLHGLAQIPEVPPEITRQQEMAMRDLGPKTMHARLSQVDPEYAEKIHPNDRQRIQRALEVWEATGRPFSWWHAHSMSSPGVSSPLLAIRVSLPQLEPVIDGRIEEMLARGALREAEDAWRDTPDADAPGWSGIGCQEVLAYLRGRIDLDECKTLWRANTRAYAKRQLTWFRGRKNAIWIDPADFETIASTIQRAFKSVVGTNHGNSEVMAKLSGFDSFPER